MEKDINKAWEDYQQEVNKRRNEIITKLMTIRLSVEPTYKKWLDQTIEFIKEEN